MYEGYGEIDGTDNPEKLSDEGRSRIFVDFLAGDKCPSLPELH